MLEAYQAVPIFLMKTTLEMRVSIYYDTGPLTLSLLKRAYDLRCKILRIAKTLGPFVSRLIISNRIMPYRWD